MIVLVAVHVSLLAWSSTRHSPTNGEVPALAAGVWHWQEGRFDLFRVNPPLVRCIAALPVIGMHPKVDWRSLQDRVNFRSEFVIGGNFVRANGERSFWLFTVARWACIPFSVLGAVVCYCWARDLYGLRAGCLATALWCFSPSILGYAQTIATDVPAASCGGLACYLFWQWLQSPTWTKALAAGVALGLTQLTKTTWLLLFPLWPELWLVCATATYRHAPIKTRASQAAQLACVLLMGIVSIDAGYGGERLFRPLGEFRFISQTLGGDVDSSIRCRDGANRFRGTWLEDLPVPLPENYVLGLDIQKFDFEVGLYSYLRGEWRTHGWWYYYLYACAVKSPIGTLTLLALATGLTLSSRSYRVGWHDEMVLLAPPLAVFLLVSSQTGMNQHFRYIIPAFPFLFIYAGKAARPTAGAGKVITWIAGTALLGTIISSLFVYPDSLSYFNEIVGGSRKGAKHLLGSNIDWGQEMLYLKEWYFDHPEARPLHLAHAAYFDPGIMGIAAREPPVDPHYRLFRVKPPSEQLGPKPGWYALSVNRLHDWTNQYSYFLHFNSIATAGYSIYIYHITLDEANRVRRELGLPELSDEPSGFVPAGEAELSSARTGK